MALAKAGCNVGMGARRVEQLEKTKQLCLEECRGTTAKAVISKTDVTSLDDVKSLIAKTEQSLGDIDILVNVAGVMYFTLMATANFDQVGLKSSISV